MAIPDFQTIMLPMLRVFGDGKEHTIRELMDTLATQFKLTEKELSEQLPSGKQGLFYNKVGWARTYLTKAGLIEMVRRAEYRITERGKDVLESKPSRIDKKYLEQFPEYLAFKDGDGGIRKPKPIEKVEDKTPEELLEDAFDEIRDGIAQELLGLVKGSTPAFFERLVVELLVAMGYGGSHRDAARAVGKRGDEGIDGIIDEDRLGLDTIYIQAKKWEGTVSRPEIQKFVGALMGKKAKKGIFITTSTFSSEAVNFVAGIEYRIVLIDGARLADLMIDHGIGVTNVTTYQLKRVDTDYFGNG